jgi:hypothetical protein
MNELVGQDTHFIVRAENVKQNDSDHLWHEVSENACEQGCRQTYRDNGHQ